MTTPGYLLVGLFLPLFPFSMIFTRLFAAVTNPWARAVLLLTWPNLGLWLITTFELQVPSWVVGWALATAAFYAWRALALREVGLWTGFMAVSAWALIWVPAIGGMSDLTLRYDVFGLTLPLVLLVFLVDGLTRRFGAAYTCLYGGLAQMMPRFSGVLALVVLAVTATPLFPGFFTLITTIVAVSPQTGLALAGVWLLWSWAGARLLQGLIVGPAGPQPVPADLGQGATWLYALILAALVIGGVSLTGELL